MIARVILRVPHVIRALVGVSILFIPSWFMLGVARAAIRLLSFNRVMGIFGLQARPNPVSVLLSPIHQRRTARIRRAVHFAAKVTPWESNCFAQALCAMMLLRAHGVSHAIFLGLERDNKSCVVSAHAWVTAGSVIVTGGGDIDRYTVVGCLA